MLGQRVLSVWVCLHHLAALRGLASLVGRSGGSLSGLGCGQLALERLGLPPLDWGLSLSGCLRCSGIQAAEHLSRRGRFGLAVAAQGERAALVDAVLGAAAVEIIIVIVVVIEIRVIVRSVCVVAQILPREVVAIAHVPEFAVDGDIERSEISVANRNGLHSQNTY